MSRELLKSQKAELFHQAKGLGFDPARLEWSIRESRFTRGKSVPSLYIRGTDYFFCFDELDSNRVAVFSPSEDDSLGQSLPESWPGMLRVFGKWLKYAEREISAPDPWAELQEHGISYDLNVDDATPDRPFSVGEHRKVTQTLEVIQALLITYAKETDAKQEGIIAGIKRLETAAETQDRKSWFQQAVGYIVSTATAMGLDPEKTKALFTALKNGLKDTILFLTN